jgi:hypothetical protein
MGRRRKATARSAYISQRRAPIHICPNCHIAHDATTNIAFDAPNRRPMGPGDLTVCANCGALSHVGPDHSLRLATQAEFDTLAPEMQKVVRIISTENTLLGKRSPVGKPPDRPQ